MEIFSFISLYSEKDQYFSWWCKYWVCNQYKNSYKINPMKQEYCRAELAYMLERDIIKSYTPCSFLCLLVPKPDDSFRFCTDLRKFNAITKTDTQYPLIKTTWQTNNNLKMVWRCIYVFRDLFYLFTRCVSVRCWYTQYTVLN